MSGDQTTERYRSKLRDDVQTWIEAIQREQAKKRKRHIPSPRYLRLVDRPAASFLIYPRTIASYLGIGVSMIRAGDWTACPFPVPEMPAGKEQAAT